MLRVRAEHFSKPGDDGVVAARWDSAYSLRIEDAVKVDDVVQVVGRARLEADVAHGVVNLVDTFGAV